MGAMGGNAQSVFSQKDLTLFAALIHDDAHVHFQI